MTTIAAISSVLPATPAEVQAWVREAIASRTPIALDAASQFPDRKRMDLSRLGAWRFWEPDDLTCGAEAGLTPQAVQLRLSERHLFLPFDLPNPGIRLGAALAGHHSGPLRQGYGTLRDFVIGIEFVTGTGELVKAGGRVVKNVAGYDLMKLMIGSRGSFGIITAANFRLFPAPAPAATWLIPCSGWEAAARFRAGLMASFLKPIALELASFAPPQFAAAADAPLWLAVRCAGDEPVRQRYERELSAMAREIHSELLAIPAEGESGFWDEWNAWPASAQARFSAPPEPALRALPRIADHARKAGLAVDFQGRLGLGAYRLRFRPLPTPEWLASMRGQLATLGENWLTLPSAASPLAAWGQLATSREFLRELKQQLDPHGILPDPFGLTAENVM